MPRLCFCKLKVFTSSTTAFCCCQICVSWYLRKLKWNSHDLHFASYFNTIIGIDKTSLGNLCAIIHISKAVKFLGIAHILQTSIWQVWTDYFLHAGIDCVLQKEVCVLNGSCYWFWNFTTFHRCSPSFSQHAIPIDESLNNVNTLLNTSVNSNLWLWRSQEIADW